jgi:hypothetical protein
MAQTRLFEDRQAEDRLHGADRLHLTVASDISTCVEQLKSAGFQFRNDLEVGPEGSQIQLQDLDGNPIEVHGRRTH